MRARVSLLAASLLALGCGRLLYAPAGADAAVDATVVGLSIAPEISELVSVDGSTPSVDLRARVTRADGTTEAVRAELWSLTHERIATLTAIEEGAAATVRATAVAGGDAIVTARYQSLSATAMVRVRVERTIPPDASVPPEIVDRFHTLPGIDDPFESAAIEYPLDGARMPGNVVAPEIQWFPRDGVGDGYRIVIEGAHVRVTAYARDDGRLFRASWPVDPAAWRILADSARGAELTVRVDRLPAAGTAIAVGAPITIWLSEDGLFGTLYYWQVRVDPQASDVLRLDAATGERRSVFSTEPGACVGCHAVSTDGRRLAATLDSRAPSWVTAFVDPASAGSPPPDLVAPVEPGYHFLAFSPDGGRILASQAILGEASDVVRLALLDAATGLPIDRATGLPEDDAGYPVWSPDGACVAWMAGGGDGPRGTTLPTRIAVAEVLAGDALGAPTVVHEGSALRDSSLEGGSTDSRPTFSPDSRWIAFAHGERSVSATEIGEAPPRAALYVVSRAGGPATRLDRGMGREGQVDAFWPVFSPFVTEERDGARHYWLAYYSRADYGNARAGTADTGRRQLWVMAIDPERLAAGADPSFPPYWVPGQDRLADDIAALWAPTACRPRDARCVASGECCSGECVATDSAMPDVLTCEPPTACRRLAETCDVDSDCCDGVCNLGVCGYEDPF